MRALLALPVLLVFAVAGCGEAEPSGRTMWDCDCTQRCDAQPPAPRPGGGAFCAWPLESESAERELEQRCDAELVGCTVHGCTCTCQQTDINCEPLTATAQPRSLATACRPGACSPALRNPQFGSAARPALPCGERPLLGIMSTRGKGWNAGRGEHR